MQGREKGSGSGRLGGSTYKGGGGGFRFRELPAGRSLQCWIYGFSIFHQDFLCVCKPGGTPTPRPGLTVHVGGPEGPDGGGTLPACSQHLHLQAVEGAGPQTRDQELGVILGKGGKALGDTGPSGAASDHDPRLDSPPETIPPCYVTVLRDHTPSLRHRVRDHTPS